MNNVQIQLVIQAEQFFIISWDKVVNEVRHKVQTSPLNILDHCLRSSSQIKLLKDLLERANGASALTLVKNDKQIVDEIKKLISDPIQQLYFARRSDLSKKISDAAVLDWIQKALSSTNDFGPWSYLSNRRNVDGLDMFDDNLPAAERYFEGYDGNYNEHFIAGSAVLKAVREIKIFDSKPMQRLLGKNGSKEIMFITKWGQMGVFDRENGITAAERVRRGVVSK